MQAHLEQRAVGRQPDVIHALGIWRSQAGALAAWDDRVSEGGVIHASGRMACARCGYMQGTRTSKQDHRQFAFPHGLQPRCPPGSSGLMRRARDAGVWDCRQEVRHRHRLRGLQLREQLRG